MIAEFAPVAGPVGALLGAVATYVITRSRLVVTVGQVSIKPSEWANELPVVVSNGLEQQLSMSPWKYPRIGADTVAESSYVNYLFLLKRELESNDVSSSNLLKILDALRGFAASEDYDKLFELYKYHQRGIYGWANAEARRGRDFFGGYILLSDDQKAEIDALAVDYKNSTAYIVNLPGTMNLIFDWDHVGANTAVAAAKALAMRAVLAFTSRNKSDLVSYFAGVREAVELHGQTERAIIETVEAELDKHSRLEIDILLSNPGRTGVSLDSTAVAEIKLDGYKYKLKNGEGVRSANSDVRIALAVVTEENAERARLASLQAILQDTEARTVYAPLVVQPGSTVRVIGTSRRLLSTYKNGAAVRSAYSGSERKVLIEVRRFRRPPFYRRHNIDSIKHVRSREVTFRDLAIDSRTEDHES
ncbi:hypothetical protein [Clavibacter phaseoli]|uniref:hypothetical protein n=1 Tax=Clavibacter phaseoli TaxID=1734031 RepID=UPI0011C21268|nr:hypothetical protein [Clavibacter phaseoli]